VPCFNKKHHVNRHIATNFKQVVQLVSHRVNVVISEDHPGADGRRMPVDVNLNHRRRSTFMSRQMWSVSDDDVSAIVIFPLVYVIIPFVSFFNFEWH